MALNKAGKPEPSIIRREYDMAGLLDENERFRALLARMAEAFGAWGIKGQSGLLAEVRAALDE